MEEDQLHYDWTITPKNASDENKSGITFKGKETKYINANRKVAEMFKIKGDKFLINNFELSVCDAPKNKPITLDVKPKTGLSGRANLKMYDVNNHGGATIMITRVSGGDMLHVKTLAFKVIKYLLDGIISGNIEDNDIGNYKTSGIRKPLVNADYCCEECEKSFPTEQGLKLHKTRIHVINMKFKCSNCKESLKTQSDLEKHIKSEHASESSPDAKKIRMDESTIRKLKMLLQRKLKYK